jgi:uncharacterized membrane protein YfcA
MLSWVDWTAGVWQAGWPFVMASVVGSALGAIYALGGPRVRRAVVLAGVGLVMALSLARGPSRWGSFAPFEPEPRSPVLRLVEAMY